MFFINLYYGVFSGISTAEMTIFYSNWNATDADAKSRWTHHYGTIVAYIIPQGMRQGVLNRMMIRYCIFFRLRHLRCSRSHHAKVFCLFILFISNLSGSFDYNYFSEYFSNVTHWYRFGKKWRLSIGYKLRLLTINQ